MKERDKQMKRRNNEQETEIKERLPKEKSEFVEAFPNGYLGIPTFVLQGEGSVRAKLLFKMLEQTLSDSERGFESFDGCKCLYGGGVQWIVVDRDSFIVDIPMEGELDTVVRVYQKSKNWSWILNHLWDAIASEIEGNEEANEHSMVA